MQHAITVIRATNRNINEYVKFWWLLDSQHMAFSYTLLEIGDDRITELCVKPIRLDGPESDPAIGIPTLHAVRGPVQRKRKGAGSKPTSLGVGQVCHGCGSPYHNASNKDCIRNREVARGGRPDDFTVL